MATQETNQGKGLYLHAKIHTIKEETLSGGPKSRGKEEVGEGE